VTDAVSPSWPVVDADVHIHEDPHELAEFADGSLRQSLASHNMSERWLDTAGYSPLTVFDPPLGDDVGKLPHVIRTKADLLADMAQLGTSKSILFTGRLLGTATYQDWTYPIGISRVYNRYLRDRWLDPDAGVYGAIMVAAQAPELSAKEIELHAGTAGFAAVYLPMAGTYPLWGHRKYDPIYAAAEAAGLPVVLMGYTIIRPTFPYQLDQFDTALAKQVISKPFGAMANLVSMTTTGVFARFPRLKVVFSECGMSWLPFVMWRLDQQVQWTEFEVPFYTEKPSEYIRRQVYVTTHRLEDPGDPDLLQSLIASGGGPGRLVFASDWPHYDADQVCRLRDSSLPDEWKRTILSDTAHSIFPI
jgi:uncharacterized protein